MSDLLDRADVDLTGYVEVDGTVHKATLTYRPNDIGWELSIVSKHDEDEGGHYYHAGVSLDECFHYALAYLAKGEGI